MHVSFPTAPSAPRYVTPRAHSVGTAPKTKVRSPTSQRSHSSRRAGEVRYVQPAPAAGPVFASGGAVYPGSGAVFPSNSFAMEAPPASAVVMGMGPPQMMPDMFGGALVLAAPPPTSAPLNMDDLPFSSMGHKAMWQGIFDQVQKEVDAYLESTKANPGAGSPFRMPRLPLPNIHERQIEMIFDSYDMEGEGYLDVDKLKALMGDMQCVNCLAMSQHKGEALAEARAEMTALMGAQLASVMSGFVSQAMDFELQMVKALSCEEVPEEDAKELLKELDADKDGKVSKADFQKNAKKALFDPNPPEEVMEAMEAAEAMMMMAGQGQLCLEGGCQGPVMLMDMPVQPAAFAAAAPPAVLRAQPPAATVRSTMPATAQGSQPRVVVGDSTTRSGSPKVVKAPVISAAQPEMSHSSSNGQPLPASRIRVAPSSQAPAASATSTLNSSVRIGNPSVTAARSPTIGSMAARSVQPELQAATSFVRSTSPFEANGVVKQATTQRVVMPSAHGSAEVPQQRRVVAVAAQAVPQHAQAASPPAAPQPARFAWPGPCVQPQTAAAPSYVTRGAVPASTAGVMSAPRVVPQPQVVVRR